MPEQDSTPIKNALYYATDDEGIRNFVRALGFNTTQPDLPCPVEPPQDGWPKRTQAVLDYITEVARHENEHGPCFRLIHTHLKTERFRRTDMRLVLEPLIKRRPQDHYLFIFTWNTPPYQQIAFVSPQWVKLRKEPYEERGQKIPIRLITRILLTDPQSPFFTDLDVLSKASTTPDEPPLQLWERHKDAFSIHRVTEQFFKDFCEVFNRFTTTFKKHLGAEQAHDYTLLLFNRIMFLYFIQRRGWLGTTQFMRQFWQAYRDSSSKNSFLRDYLNPLFFTVFNRPPSERDLSAFPTHIVQHLQNAPYLNGGLFRKTSTDPEPTPSIPDSLFELLFERWKKDPNRGFLERYNFTILETGPFDQLVAVDPEMIGRIYESMVNITEEPGKVPDEIRAEKGIFYTPRTEVDLMCRLAISDFLINHLTEEHRNTIIQWLFSLAQDEKEEADQQIQTQKLTERIYDLIHNITVCDPACGSGAFLVGSLLVLDDLLQRLQRLLSINEDQYSRRKRIIGRNLYGIDIMPWAVHIAELRLWLQLAVETDIPDHLLHSDQPLLPNFTFNLRTGDSLVQKIGDTYFTLHTNPTDLSKHLRGKLQKLKKRKLAHYNAEPDAPSEEEIRQEERRLLEHILLWKIDRVEKRLRGLTRYPTQKKTLIKIAPVQQELTIQRQTDEAKTELSGLKKALHTLKSEEHPPFIWDLAFVEIFETDKGGFDIIIGNPPYVRQELINRMFPDKPNYKNELTTSLQRLYHNFFRNRKFPGRADLCIYFYLHALKLLNPNGSFCFITSNSWLDVDYGKILQESLLRHSHIKLIIDNKVQRSFARSDINTIIALLAPPNDSSNWGLEKDARFTMFNTSFDDIIHPVIFMEIFEAEEFRTRKPEFRCITINQHKLLEEGLDETKSAYLGNKWGGKYLRAPDIFFTILEKGKDKLVRLGDIAEVRFGIKTGANEFFYLQPLDMSVAEVAELAKKNPKSPVRVKNGAGWQGKIEAAWLKPIIKSLREIKTIKVRLEDLSNLVFMPPDDVQNALKKHKSNPLRGYPLAAAYIKWGEKQRYQNRPTCKSRPFWWNLGYRPVSDVLYSYILGDRHFMPVNRVALVDNNLFDIYVTVVPELVLSSILSSPLFRLMLEVQGREMTGALTVLKIQIYELCGVLIADPRTFLPREAIRTAFERLSSRAIKSLFEEEGFTVCRRRNCNHPEHPFEYVNPEELTLNQVKEASPDRYELDKVVFDVLGLTDEERAEVYRAVCDLVKSRLLKAQSV